MYITYQYTDEGVGAQYQRILGLYAISKAHNLKYIHNKIQVGHNYDNDILWDDKWDNIFGLGKISCTDDITGVNIENINYLEYRHLSQQNNNKLLKIASANDLFESAQNMYYNSIQDDILSLYYNNNQNVNLYLFDKNKVNIAMHVRVSNDCDIDSEKVLFSKNDESGRYINNNTYENIIKHLNIKYPNSLIHIFTQPSFDTKHASLRNFENVRVHKDVDAFDSFHHMTRANIFVMAKSSFSYLIGLYNVNKVLYIPFWHKPLDKWEILNIDSLYAITDMKHYVNENTIPKNIKRIKLDIGLSYNAPQTQQWLEHDNDLFVFGFEPNSDGYTSILKGNIQKINIEHSKPIENKFIYSKLCLIPVALGNVENKSEMDFYKMSIDCGTSSLKQPVDKTIGPVKEIVKVDVYSLKHFFDIFDWNRFPYIEYIKIDAQGSDYDILVSAGDYLKRVVYITAEAESSQYLNSSQNSLNNFQSYLATLGFVEINHPNTNDPTFINNNYMHIKDTIFISQI